MTESEGTGIIATKEANKLKRVCKHTQANGQLNSSSTLTQPKTEMADRIQQLIDQEV